MSWQTYIDSNLLGTGKVTQAAICGLDGNLWAYSKGFQPTPAEATAIIKGIQSDSSVLAASGIKVNGTKYMFLQAIKDEFAYGKKGNDGVCCIKTGQCLIIGTYENGIQPGECSVAVGKVADHLRNSGY
ncbi:Profilin-2 [Trichoplax sp. H2]|nr:Profilin-2 [Trichoplax sp. H2]|eukprot:RDD38467.1 Profilin-2 [Trichoplax sp. H2]